MQNNLYERIDRLKAVEREYRVLFVAITQLRVPAIEARASLPQGTSLRDIEAAKNRLEATYLIRLWAEFETALRSYYGWLTSDPNPRIRAIDLVITLHSSRRGKALSLAYRGLIHEVREYRNTLVHDRDEPAPPVALSEAKTRLNRFLGAKLPEHWG